MGFLSKFEGRMESAFEGASSKLGGSSISPVQIIRKAERLLRRESMVSAGREYAPTLFTVLVSPEDDRRLFGFYPTLASDCELSLLSAAAAEGLEMDGRPLVRFMEEPTLKRGRLEVVAEVVSSDIVEQLRESEMVRYGLAPASPSPRKQDFAGQPFGQPASAGQPFGRPVAADQAPAYDPSDPFSPKPPEAFAAAFANQPLDDFPVETPSSDSDWGGSSMGASAMGASARGRSVQEETDQGVSDADFMSAQKPPLPYVPEEEIDRSIDYGEYTFDSKNFTDYSNPDLSPVYYNGAYAPGAAGVAGVAVGAGAGAGAAVGAGSGAAVGAAGFGSAGRHASPMAQTRYFAPEGRNPLQPSAIPDPSRVLAQLRDMRTGRMYDIANTQVLVGRETYCDVSLADPNASREHAQLMRDGRGVWGICDLGSTNGTFVNGRRVTQSSLRNGDAIRVGWTDLEFLDPDRMGQG